MPKYPWIEFPLLFLMVVGPLLIVGYRSGISFNPEQTIGTTKPPGIGARVIQCIAFLVLVPLVGILGLEKILTADSVGALIGVAIGYTLSGIEKPVPHDKDKKSL